MMNTVMGKTGNIMNITMNKIEDLILRTLKCGG